MTEHDRRMAAMFDAIAPRYDRLNRLLSFGADAGWRRRAVELALLEGSGTILDVGAGTGDLAGGLLSRSPASSRAIGLDLAPRMLEVSRRRLAHHGPRYLPVVGSAEALPLPSGSVDRVISGFTLRNIGDLPRALGEAHRVLRPGGRAVLLELSHPRGPFALAYRWYFESVLPPLAVAMGGDPAAYRYLPRSLRGFPGAERLAGMIREAGFARVRYERLTLGIAAIHVAEKA